jgi:hypothetical protein
MKNRRWILLAVGALVLAACAPASTAVMEPESSPAPTDVPPVTPGPTDVPPVTQGPTDVPPVTCDPRGMSGPATERYRAWVLFSVEDPA